MFSINPGSPEYIVLNLTKNKFYVTYYSYQSPNTNQDKNWYPLSNWILEGSNDFKNYYIIDNATNLDLYSSKKVITRKIENHGVYSSFKLTMVGKNSGNINGLRVFKLDFFGSLCSDANNCPAKYEEPSFQICAQIPFTNFITFILF